MSPLNRLTVRCALWQIAHRHAFDNKRVRIFLADSSLQSIFISTGVESTRMHWVPHASPCIVVRSQTTRTSTP